MPRNADLNADRKPGAGRTIPPSCAWFLFLLDLWWRTVDDTTVRFVKWTHDEYGNVRDIKTFKKLPEGLTKDDAEREGIRKLNVPKVKAALKAGISPDAIPDDPDLLAACLFSYESNRRVLEVFREFIAGFCYPRLCGVETQLTDRIKACIMHVAYFLANTSDTPDRLEGFCSWDVVGKLIGSDHMVPSFDDALFHESFPEDRTYVGKYFELFDDKDNQTPEVRQCLEMDLDRFNALFALCTAPPAEE